MSQFPQIPAPTLRAARDLCAGSGATNPEYVRGQAELLIDTTYGLSMDDKADLIAYLGGE